MEVKIAWLIQLGRCCCSSEHLGFDPYLNEEREVTLALCVNG